MVLSQWVQFYLQGSKNWFLGGGLQTTLDITVVSGLPKGYNIYAMYLCVLKWNGEVLKNISNGSLGVDNEQRLEKH